MLYISDEGFTWAWWNGERPKQAYYLSSLHYICVNKVGYCQVCLWKWQILCDSCIYLQRGLLTDNYANVYFFTRWCYTQCIWSLVWWCIIRFISLPLSWDSSIINKFILKQPSHPVRNISEHFNIKVSLSCMIHVAVFYLFFIWRKSTFLTIVHL